VTLVLDDVIKLLLAVLIGGLIGAEREFRDKAAGFRTIILICIGATLFTIFSLRLGKEVDPVRIAASIVSGVGFLGAGAILRDGGRISGLTTASTIWLAAALGMGIGGGYILFSGVAAVVVLIVLWVFPGLEARLDRAREYRTYEITCGVSPVKLEELEKAFRDCGLRIVSRKQTRRGDQMIVVWAASGTLERHAELARLLFADSDIGEFRF